LIKITRIKVNTIVVRSINLVTGSGNLKERVLIRLAFELPTSLGIVLHSIWTIYHHEWSMWLTRISKILSCIIFIRRNFLHYISLY